MRGTAKNRLVQIERLENRQVLAAAILGLVASDLPEYEVQIHGDYHGQDHDDHDDHDHPPVAFSDGGGNWNPGTSMDITRRITVQPIVVSNTNGANTAGFFGTSANQLEIEEYVDQVWAQAGIDVDWLSALSWNNSFANVGSGSVNSKRPTSDLSSIVSQAESAGLTHSDPNTLNMYFVEISPGFSQLEDNFANGLAYIGANGSTLHIGDDLVGSTTGQQTVARVVAHEIGHNMGLRHVTTAQNLMENGALLTNSQISSVRSSPFAVEITNNAPQVDSPIPDVVVTQGQASGSVSLASVFSDPDDDALTYSVSTSNSDLLTPQVSGSNLQISYANGMSGSAILTVTATDTVGASVSDQFLVTVNPTVPTTATDLGSVAFASTNVNLDNIAWLELSASQAGFLTLEASFNSALGDVSATLFDANMNALVEAVGNAGELRADIAATAGATYYVRLLGNNSGVSVSLANLVSAAGTTVQVAGTSQGDVYSFTPGSLHELTVNGIDYFFASSSVNSFNIAASAEQDSVNLSGLTSADTATFTGGQVTWAGLGYTVVAAAETLTVVGGSNDSASFADSSGIDTFNGNSVQATMNYADGSVGVAQGFGTVVANSNSGGADTAFLFDGPTDDLFDADSANASLVSVSGAFANYANGFETVFGYSLAGGNDSATLRDGSGDDLFVVSPDDAYLRAINGDFFNQVFGFQDIDAESSAGNDSAVFYDSVGNDTFTASTSQATFSSSSYASVATNFTNVLAYATAGGTDSAILTDSLADDTFVASDAFGYVTGDSGLNYAGGFESVTAHSTGGSDLAIFFDSAGNDSLFATQGLVTLSGSGFQNSARDFPQVFSFSSSGNDTATFTDSAADDTFAAGADYAYMRTDDYINYAGSFGSVTAQSSSGNDVAVLYDGVSDDRFVASANQASMAPVSGGWSVEASGFATAYGYSINGGSDIAELSGGASNDSFVGSADFSSMSGSGFNNIATGFGSVLASGGQGNDTASLFDAAGDDQLSVSNAAAVLTSGSSKISVSGFFYVAATSSAGGTDVLDEEAVDYLFEAFGDWT